MRSTVRRQIEPENLKEQIEALRQLGDAPGFMVHRRTARKDRGGVLRFFEAVGSCFSRLGHFFRKK